MLFRSEAVARKVYGADGVEFSANARAKLKRFAGWGFGNLIELPLLAMLLDISPDSDTKPPKPWPIAAAGYVDDLLQLSSEYDFQRYSTRRQLERYAYWFLYVNPTFTDVASVADDLLQRFPRDG